MSNITPSTPSVFSYWRPWKENSNVFDSYLDYTKDTTLAKYGADTVGNYIKQTSKEQVQSINRLGDDIGRGLDVLSDQLSDIYDSLSFLNRNMDIQIEQQKLSILLLQNIGELLRVPDNEKERQHSIELGIKFFVNAKKDPDLYADALEELLKAESLMKQDYFVLHRIGCIYLHVNKYINPEKALDYFLRAAKYASVESDSDALNLVNILTNNFNTVNSDINNSEEQIGLLAADSYEKAAFSSYVIGRFEDAVNYQARALKFNPIPQNRFLLSKYQVRNNNIEEAIINLSECIDQLPDLAIAIFKEIDLINEPKVLNLIATKNADIDNKIKLLAEKWKTVESINADKVIKKLTVLSKKSYEIKIAEFNKFDKGSKKINKNINKLETEIDLLIKKISNNIYATFDKNKLSSIINDLNQAKDLPLEKMQEVFDKLNKELDSDILQIGSFYEGGLVIWIDESGKHGLVCADWLGSSAFWGTETYIKDPAGDDFYKTGSDYGMIFTKLIVEFGSVSESREKWYSSAKKKYLTAARHCLEGDYNGFTGWYLPTSKEMELIYDNREILDKAINKRYNIDIGIFRGKYWCSDLHLGSFLLTHAKFFDIVNGEQHLEPRDSMLCFRAVRRF